MNMDNHSKCRAGKCKYQGTELLYEGYRHIPWYETAADFVDRDISYRQYVRNRQMVRVWTLCEMGYGRLERLVR